MNVISAYLETMFSAYPQSPRMLEAKAELHTMMEDAYNGFIADGLSENEAVGRVITDFGNLDELAPTLGISQEITPGVPANQDPASSANSGHPAILLSEAQGLAEAHRRTRFRLAIGVALIVLSPAALITLATAAETEGLPGSVAAAIGLGVLFALIAAGTLMIVSISRDFAPFEHLRDGAFTPTAEVSDWADALAADHERGRIRALQAAILCWVLCPVPLLLLSLLVQGELRNLWSVIGVSIVLVLVALGLLILLPASWAHTAAGILRGGRSAHGGGSDESDHSLVGVIAPIYWPLAVAIYLGWSFIGDAWAISWIVWPIAGVLFGAIAGGISAWERRKKALSR